MKGSSWKFNLVFDTLLKEACAFTAGVNAVLEILVLGRHDLNFTRDTNDQIRPASQEPVYAHSQALEDD